MTAFAPNVLIAEHDDVTRLLLADTSGGGRLPARLRRRNGRSARAAVRGGLTR